MLSYYWGHSLLPRGSPLVVLGLAFTNESLLMGLHEKHEPLDRVGGWLPSGGGHS